MADQSFLARLQAMSYDDEGGGGGGGGATPIASSGNIFEVNSSLSGPGEMQIEGLSKILDMSTGEELKDLMNLMNESSVLKALFGNMNAGPLIPTIDYMAALKPKTQSIFSAKLTDRVFGIFGPTTAH
jgi:hypothetical protein